MRNLKQIRTIFNFVLIILATFIVAFSNSTSLVSPVLADEEVTASPSPVASDSVTPTLEPSTEPSTLPSPSPDTVNTQSDFCAQVMTYACMDSNPSVCQQYSSPCNVPVGWTVTTEPSATPPTPTPSPSTSPSTIVVPTVTVGTTYTGPASNVKVKFNSISGSAGSLTISETTLSASAISTIGALSSTAYDISSSMSNGSFTYNLTLPIPAGVTVSNLKVLYASSVDNLSAATQVGQSITDNGDGTFTIQNLDHFTVFVVVDPNTQANCDAVTVGTTAGTTCVATIQQAINNATDNNSPLDTITVAAGTYNETVHVTKRLIITGQGSPTVTGGFILETTPVTISGFSASTSVVIISPTISALVGAYSGNQASYPVSGTGAANATLNYTITGTSGSTSGSTTVNSSGTFSFNADLTSLGEGTFTVDVQLTSLSYTSSHIQATQAKDSISPTAPASITVPTQVDSTNLTTFSISGSGAEAGSKVSYTITSSGTTVSATDVTTVLANGTFSISNINVSSLPDSSNVIVSVTLKDNAGPSNTGNTSSATTNPTNSLKKDTSAPTTTDDTDSSWHNSSVTISLTCTDTVSGCFKTYYTTDGSTPTTASSQGTSIILTTDGQYTIKYFSVDNYGNTQAVQTAANLVKIDKTNPNTNPGTPTTTPNPTSSTSQTWNWTAATDALSGIYQYFWRTTLGGVAGPNGIVNAPTASVNTNLTQGAWNFFVLAKDNAANQSSEIQGSVLVDTTAPVTSDNTDSLWHNSAVTITLTCSDTATGNSGCATTYYTTDGSTPTTSSSTGNSITLSAQGQYTIKYFSVDAATTGNQESVKTAANTVNIDTTNPTVSANNASASWNLANISITLTVSDSGGSVLNIAKYSWDTPATSTVGTSFNSGDFITIPSEGSNTLYLYASDNALNSNSFSGSYKLDTVNPTASVSNSSSTWQTSLPSMIVTATDSESLVASVTYSWNGGASVATSNGVDLSSTLPADGMNTLVLTVTDNAGRVTTFSGTYNIDRVSPTAGVSGSSASWQSSVPSVVISASDPTPGSGLATVQYSWNSGIFVSSFNGADIIASLTLLGNGTHSLSVVVTDVSGRATVISGTYKIDTSIPVISGVTLTNTTGNNSFVKNGDTVTLTATVTDNNQSLLTSSMITANLSAFGGGASVSPTTYNSLTGLATWANLTVTGTTNGVITVTVNAVDIAANSATAATVTTTADNILPTLSLINLTSSNANINLAKVGDTVTLTFSSSETIQTLVVTIAGQTASVSNVGNVWTAAYVMTSTDTEGLMSYQITFADLALNVGTPISATSTITFDKTNPTASWTTPTALANVSGNVTLTAGVTDTTGIASVAFMYQRNDGVDTFHAIATVTSAPFTTVWDTNSLTLDNYTLRMIVLDNTGNSTTLDQIVGVATVIQSSTVAATSTSSSSVTIVWTTDDQTSSRVIYDTTSHPVLSTPPNYGYANSTTVQDSTTKVTNHSVQLTGLQAGTTYYYRVVSAGSPESVSSEFSFTTSAATVNSGTTSSGTTTAGAPMLCSNVKPSKAPWLLSAKATANGEVTLVWADAGGSYTFYTLEYGLSPNKPHFGVANLGKVNTYTVKGLAARATYYFRLRAINDCVPSDYSNELSAKAVASVLGQVTQSFEQTLAASNVQAAAKTTSLDGLSDQEFSLNDATSSLQLLDKLSSTPSAAITKSRTLNRILLGGLGVIFVLSAGATYYFSTRKKL